MKKSILTTMIIAFVSVIGMNAQEMDKFQVQVDGLGCPFCAYGLEKKFKEFKGIKNVAIEIETGDFTFDYPTEKNLTMDAVVKQVEKAGYTPITTKIVRANGTIENSGTTGGVAENAQLSSDQLYVYGKCGMCEARIIKAAKSLNGVASASWNQDSKILKVEFDEKTIKLSDIEMAVVKAGHDTKNKKAADATYNDLPACCHYERENQ
ncbi:MAG: heavy-metal-associated domain-containing protein [Flavobacteriaceae bacterium]|nr:heavy-metal-associated domain-containing protein [Flavobacteriaceae bacterium]